LHVLDKLFPLLLCHIYHLCFNCLWLRSIKIIIIHVLWSKIIVLHKHLWAQRVWWISWLSLHVIIIFQTLHLNSIFFHFLKILIVFWIKFFVILVCQGSFSLFFSKNSFLELHTLQLQSIHRTSQGYFFAIFIVSWNNKRLRGMWLA